MDGLFGLMDYCFDFLCLAIMILKEIRLTDVFYM